MRYLNRCAITLSAKPELLRWIKEEFPGLKNWTQETVNEMSSVYTIDGGDPNKNIDCVRAISEEILLAELKKMPVAEERYPSRLDYSQLSEWFTWIYHDDVCDMSERDIEFFDE